MGDVRERFPAGTSAEMLEAAIASSGGRHRVFRLVDVDREVSVGFTLSEAAVSDEGARGHIMARAFEALEGGRTDFMTPKVKGLIAKHGRHSELLNELELREEDAGRQAMTFGDAEELVEELTREWRRMVSAAIGRLEEKLDAIDDTLASSTVEARLVEHESELTKARGDLVAHDERLRKIEERFTPEWVQENMQAAIESLYGRRDTPDG